MNLSILRRSLPVLAAFFLACGKEAPPPEVPAPSADFCAELERERNAAKEDELGPLSRQLVPLSAEMGEKTGVYVLEDGGGAMMARAYLSENAERTIDVQYFIFSADNVGLIAADYLVRAADRGVRVRILVDDVLVEADAAHLLALDSRPNLEIRIYNPGMKVGITLSSKLWNVATDFRGVNQRMHNKTFTVDGRVSITGGRNIADEYFDYDHEYNFRDRDVLLLGGVVGEIEQSFEQFWNDPLSMPVAELVPAEKRPQEGTADQQLAWLRQYACNPANYWPEVRELLQQFPTAFQHILASGELQWVDGIEYISDLPGKNSGREGLGGGGKTLDALTALVREAKDSITIETPYLVTTEVGQQLFRETVARGVKVRILTNSLAATDNFDAFSGYQRDRETLLKTGVRIFEFRPDAAMRARVMTGVLAKTLKKPPIFGLHSKSMVIDGHTTVIGTFNLDPRSANLNTESITVIRSENITAKVTAGMEEALLPENAWETTLESNPDHHASRAKRFKAWTRGIVPKEIL